jgi:hypothetical protein
MALHVEAQVKLGLEGLGEAVLDDFGLQASGARVRVQVKLCV